MSPPLTKTCSAIGYHAWLTTTQSENSGANRPAGSWQLRRYQTASRRRFRATDRLGTGIPGLLRTARENMRAVAMRRRQRKQSSDIQRAIEYLRDYQERTQ